MADDFKIEGKAEAQLKNLAKALDDAANVELRKALHAGLRAAVKEHAPVAAGALAAALPTRMKASGERVKQSISVNASRDPGVSVSIRYVPHGRGIGAANAKQINQSGTFRHRVFGSNTWVSQSVPAGEGWFDKSWTGLAPNIRASCERFMDELANDIVRVADHGGSLQNPHRQGASGTITTGGL